MRQHLLKGNGFESAKDIVAREAVARGGWTRDTAQKAGQSPFASKSRVAFVSEGLNDG